MGAVVQEFVAPKKQSAPPETSRIPFLDGIRGLASLWVLVGHVSVLTGVHIPIITSTNLAVDIFMVMSGFLMAQHFFLRQNKEPWESPQTWVAFYLRRFFRIAPVYYALLIPAIVLHGSVFPFYQALIRSLFTVKYDPTESAMTAVNVLAHITFVFGLVPKYCSSTLLPDWSIGLEMQFYLIFPLAMVIARRIGIISFSLATVAIWIAANHWIALYISSMPKRFGLFPQPSFLPLKAIFFLAGILLAWAYMENKGVTPRSFAVVFIATLVSLLGHPVVFVLILFVIFLLFYDEDSMKLGLGTAAHVARSMLGGRIASFLGDVSYGVYLLHMLLLVSLLKALGGVAWYAQLPSTMKFLSVLACIMPVCYVIAWLLSKVIEQPGIRVGKALVRRIQSRPVPI